MHVHSRLHRDREGLVQGRHPAVHPVHPVDVHPVAHHEAVEAQLLAQDVLQQPGIAMAGNPVQFIVGRHDRRHAGLFDGHLEGRQVEFAELPLGHVHRGGIDAPERFPASDEMLGAGEHMAFRQVPVRALQAPDQMLAHLADQVRVFAVGLPHPAPAGVPGHIQIRRKGPVHPGPAHFQRSLRPDFLQQFRIERGGHVDVGRIDRAAFVQGVPVDGVHADEQRNPQPAFLRQLLQGGGLLGGQHVQKGTDLPAADLVGDAGIAEVLVRRIDVLVRRPLPRRHIAGGYILAHLADLFFQRHLRQEDFGPVGGGQRSVAEVLRGARRSRRQDQQEYAGFHVHRLESYFSVRLTGRFTGTSEREQRRMPSAQVQPERALPFASTDAGLAARWISKE